MLNKNSWFFPVAIRTTMIVLLVFAQYMLAAQKEATVPIGNIKAQIQTWYDAYKQGKSEAAFSTFMDSTSAVINSYLYRKDYETIATLYEHCIQLAKDNKDEKTHLKFAVLLGNFYKIKGNFLQSNAVLLSALDKNGLDNDKAQQYLHIASNYIQIDPTKSKYYLDEAQKIMPNIKDTATLMLYHFDRGTYYRLNNDMNNAIQEEILAMKYMDNFPVQKVGSLIKLSDYMFNLNNLQPALDYLETAAKYYDPNKDRRTHSFVLLAKSKVFHKQKNDAAAIDATNEAYNYLKTTKLINQQAKCLYFLAGYYASANNQTEYEKTIGTLKQLVSEMEDNNFKEASLLTITKYELEKGNIKEGEKYFNQININKQLKDFTGKDDYLALKAKILTAKGNNALAIQTLESLVLYKDSIELNNTKSIVAYQESQYNRLEKEKEINQLSKDSENKSKKIGFISIVSSILGLILLLVLWFYRQLKSKNTQIYQQNEQLKGLLKDKDFLLKEIHHRVKNNLQVVSSLLNLQSNYIQDPVALDAINEGKNRVSSMALIHKNLYTDDNLTSIETIRYFDDLIDQLFESYNIDEDKITIEKDIDSMQLDVDTMIPLGLVTNELMSNALKHAFTESLSGTIKFSLKDEGDTILVQIKDNGKGINKDVFTSSQSFGNKMITAFVQKLKASLNIINHQGTEITLVISKQHVNTQRA